MSDKEKSLHERLSESFEVLEDTVEPCNGGFQWTAKRVGFGEFYFYMENDKIMCSNELMSKKFIRYMLMKLVDECELDCPSSKDDDKS